jgi:hypothetical protein
MAAGRADRVRFAPHQAALTSHVDCNGGLGLRGAQRDGREEGVELGNVLKAFVAPHLEAAKGFDAGSIVLLQFMARAAAEPDESIEAVKRKEFDPVWIELVKAVRRALPDASDEAIGWGALLAGSALLHQSLPQLARGVDEKQMQCRGHRSCNAISGSASDGRTRTRDQFPSSLGKDAQKGKDSALELRCQLLERDLWQLRYSRTGWLTTQSLSN